MSCSRVFSRHGRSLLTTLKGGPLVTIPVRQYALAVGYLAEKVKTFTQEDVQAFSNVSGDLNPLHMDADYAKTTRFRRPVVHGVLQLSVISALVGTELPGAGTIALKYEVEHPHPLYIGEEMKAKVEITEIDRRRITMKMTCTSVLSDKITTIGHIKVLAPKELLI